MSCSCELVSLLSVFFFKQKTAYEMRISDWSSDVCSSDLFLVLENDLNAAHRLVRDTDERPLFYTAQWNDDYHHAMHVLLTGEDGGYYIDYADAPARHLGRALAEGFAYQGEASEHRAGDRTNVV